MYSIGGSGISTKFLNWIVFPSLATCWVDGGGLPGFHRGVGWGGDGLGWGGVIPTQRLATLVTLRLHELDGVGMGWGGVG